MKTKTARTWIGAALAVAGLHLAAGAAVTAQGDPAAGAGDRDFGFFRVWILGGGGLGFLFLLPLEVASIATAAFILEHLVTVQRDRLVPAEVVGELETLLDEGRVDDAITLCETAPNYVTRIVGAAIARLPDGYDAMVDAAQGVTDEENLKLQHKVSWLPLLGNVGPLMGLFGTVTGMVMAFTQIAASATPPTPQELAAGIFTALVTTVWGLLVAIPATFFAYLFKVRVQRLSFELSGVALEIVERFKPQAGGATP
jgi:biopolymer transport protein ExbB